MKKILIILFILMIVNWAEAQSYAAQKAQQDWVKANKQSFIGKPFSVLYDALTLKPQSVYGGISHANRFIEPTTDFLYVDTTNYEDTAFSILIEWQHPPLYTTTMQYQNDMYRAFNTQEYSIYKNLIISKIDLIPNKFTRPPIQPPPPIPGHWIVTSCTYKKVLIDGYYQWRYEIIKKYCENGNTGTAQDITYATTSQAVENCVVGAGAE